MTRKHNRTPFSTKSLLMGHDPADMEALNTPAGLVRPLSVAMPDVRFPTGLFPLAFHATSVPQDDRTSALFGRAYRYLASVVFENGSLEEIVAGFTTFTPTPPPPCSSSYSDELLPLSLHFPNGRLATPGASLMFGLATTDLDDGHTVLRDARIATSVIGTDGRIWSTNVDELHTPYIVSTSHGRTSIALLPRIAASVFVPVHLPTGASSGAHFTVAAQLHLELERVYNISTLRPQYLTVGDYIPGDYADGADAGWAYGKCDQQYHRTRRCSASVPLELPLSADSPHYLSEEGQILPRVLFAAEDDPDQWECARPVVLEDETAGSRILPEFPWAVNDLQGFVGVFVGPLWAKMGRTRR
ncbi:hypothetical protein AURDEDRAFT_165375 [Auricularia subglabra TFB-10046 SS5]|nr:hypothetical protein AURDEDRAFT_165375 [Auricularia subglabra TFB-10046 SS5]